MSDAAADRDPVCGMTVKPTSPHAHVHRGVTCRFCSAKCLEKFRAEPERYLEAAGAPSARAEARAQGGKWTCPMHPEVVRDGPGACPICGMALEPMDVLAEDEGPNPELADMTRRFWVSVALTVPVFVLGMTERLPLV